MPFGNSVRWAQPERPSQRHILLEDIGEGSLSEQVSRAESDVVFGAGREDFGVEEPVAILPVDMSISLPPKSILRASSGSDSPEHIPGPSYEVMLKPPVGVPLFELEEPRTPSQRFCTAVFMVTVTIVGLLATALLGECVLRICLEERCFLSQFIPRKDDGMQVISP